VALGVEGIVAALVFSRSLVAYSQYARNSMHINASVQDTFAARPLESDVLGGLEAKSSALLFCDDSPNRGDLLLQAREERD